MEKEKKFFIVNDNDQLILSRSKIFQDFRVGLVILFFIFFLASISYWLYEVYTINNIEIKFFNHDVATGIKQLSDLTHDTAHEIVAFQAAILSFLLTAAAYRL